MISSRRPPTFIPWTPWSHPGITSPAPRVKVNGSFRLQDESNSCQLVVDADVVDANAVAGDGFVAFAFDQVLDLEFLGGAPFGGLTTGFVDVADSALAGVSDPVVESPLPQPATAITAQVTSIAISSLTAGDPREI